MILRSHEPDADALSALLLELPIGANDATRPLLESFRRSLLDALVEEGLRHGPHMSTGRALRALLGDEAVAHALLTHDLSVLLGVIVRIEVRVPALATPAARCTEQS
jgi:hypothetical protein